MTGLLLQQDADWSVLGDEGAVGEFIEFCRYHGVTALVAYYLRGAVESAEPVQVLKRQLHDIALHEVAFELFRANQSQRVLAACREQGMQPLVIKVLPWRKRITRHRNCVRVVMQIFLSIWVISTAYKP